MCCFDLADNKIPYRNVVFTKYDGPDKSPPIRKVGKVGRKILEGNMMGNVLSGIERCTYPVTSLQAVYVQVCTHSWYTGIIGIKTI